MIDVQKQQETLAVKDHSLILFKRKMTRFSLIHFWFISYMSWHLGRICSAITISFVFSSGWIDYLEKLTKSKSMMRWMGLRFWRKNLKRCSSKLLTLLIWRTFPWILIKLFTFKNLMKWSSMTQSNQIPTILSPWTSPICNIKS